MEKIITDKPRTVFVDYAHTPDGIEKVLDSVKKTTKGKIIFIIGTGGNRDKTKRPIMAQKASNGSDYVILTTDNPRFENPQDILSDMEKGIEETKYVKIADREEAIFHAIEVATENDIVIIAGKGHEQYQIIEDKTIPFNDKEIALRAIRKICG